MAEIAADMGSSEAFNLLAVFYKNGVSAQSNIIMAAIYFKIAADRGIVSSMIQFANIMMQIGNKEIESDEFNKQLRIAENIIQSIEGKSNKVYKEIRYTLEAIENKEVALFVSSKYFEKAAQNGNEEAEKILKKINAGLSIDQDHPEFYDDLTQSISCEPTFSTDQY